MTLELLDFLACRLRGNATTGGEARVINATACLLGLRGGDGSDTSSFHMQIKFKTFSELLTEAVSSAETLLVVSFLMQTLVVRLPEALYEQQDFARLYVAPLYVECPFPDVNVGGLHGLSASERHSNPTFSICQERVRESL